MSDTMRQFILIIFFCVLCFANIANGMTTNEYVNHLEKTLFGANYKNLPIDKRIDKIEMQIYDNCYSGSPEERLEKIDKIYPRSEFEAKKISTKKENIKNNNYSQEEFIEPEKADYNNYPVVSEIEQKIYNKNYQGEDIYKRLSRIEKELYGMEKSDQSLQERVTNLKSILPAKKESPFGEQKYNTNNIDNIDFDKTKKAKNHSSSMNSIEWTNLLINLMFIGLSFLL